MAQNRSGFTPTGDLLLVLADPVPKATAGGIELPDTVREAQGKATRTGIIVALGTLARQHPRLEGVTEGDRILFPRYAGDMLPIDDELYLIMRGESVLGPSTKPPNYQLNYARPSMEVFGSIELPKLVMPNA